MFKGVDHVVIAVQDLDKAIEQFEALYGMECSERGEPVSSGLRYAYFRFGDTYTELISPVSDEGPVARRLSQSGDGLYLIAMRVDNIDEAVDELRTKGMRLLGDPGPGNPVTGQILIHPSSAGGVLTRLVQR
jgi:methylmalonyl-CoA/ethylmalonyl-CoA epimerase